VGIRGAPRILGVLSRLSRGILPLQIVAEGDERDWWVSVVMNKTDDLNGATASFLEADQSKAPRRSPARSASAASGIEEDTKIVRSSTCESTNLTAGHMRKMGR
jgi:hypothetical protein